MSSLLRTIRRRSARRKMEEAGHTKVAKKKHHHLTRSTYSYFQENWKNW